MRVHLPGDRRAWREGETTVAERELLARYVECTERVDLEGLAALLHENARFSMPPEPGVWAGKDSVVACWADGGFGSRKRSRDRVRDILHMGEARLPLAASRDHAVVGLVQGNQFHRSTTRLRHATTIHCHRSAMRSSTTANSVRHDRQVGGD